MKAFVTSIGESTTELCVWSLKRNGFDVQLIENGSLLADKLKSIYEQVDEDFVRVDADVVINKTFTPDLITKQILPKQWWNQYMSYGWFKQNLIHGGAQFIRKEALPALRQHVDEYHHSDRPETMLSRIPEFYNPRRFVSVELCAGLHGFAANDIERVKRQKQKRQYFETFDFELAAKLEGLLK
jgi:hypothetical protein